MNHALNEANELQLRIDALMAERATLKPEPVDPKKQVKYDEAKALVTSLQKQLEKANAKWSAIGDELRLARSAAETKHHVTIRDLEQQVAALTAAQTALLDKAKR